MTTTFRPSSSASIMIDARPARIRSVRAEERDEETGEHPVDGAVIVRLVEGAAAQMQQMEMRLDTISSRSLDLLRAAQDERQRFQAELIAAGTRVESWKARAMIAECGLRDATLRAVEADLRRADCEAALQKAHEEADAAYERIRVLEFHLLKIDAAVRARFSLIAEAGRIEAEHVDPKIRRIGDGQTKARS